MAITPVPGTPFSGVIPPDTKTLADIREKAGEYIEQMTHCGKCRADAAGLLNEPMSNYVVDCLKQSTEMPLRPEEHRPYIAVASTTGKEVDLHLGAAPFVSIYQKTPESYQLLEERIMPDKGLGDARWEKVSDLLGDCRLILVGAAGGKPRTMLREMGLDVLSATSTVDNELMRLFHQRKILSENDPMTVSQALGGKSRGCGGGGFAACGA